MPRYAALMKGLPLHTERLIVRPWQARDLLPFAALNADPEVHAYFLGPLTRAQSDALVQRYQVHMQQHGFGMWAVETHVGGFVGSVGLNVPAFAAPFMPCTEVGWRLNRASWGQGLATEAVRAVLGHAYHACGLRDVVAFTVPQNLRSRRVMDRVGFVHAVGENFKHPGVPRGHPLEHHVLYRMHIAPR